MNYNFVFCRFALEFYVLIFLLMKYLGCLICMLLLLTVGCSSGAPEDPRLLEIAKKVSDSPKDMLERLNSMDVVSMNASDRYFHALLNIKAKDKAYIKHTSDSLILKVIDYYSSHPKSGLYPEALYYGGRVYSDIGDAPTALRYFHDALDALPEGKDDGFRAVILSQVGSMLNSLRLHNEATGYLKNASGLFLQRDDSLNAMLDIQLLGAVYMHTGHYDIADTCFRKAREIAVGISHRDTIIQDMYMAGSKLYSGNVSEALGQIRSVVRNQLEKKRDIVYAYASQIYLEAGILDTAYLFAVKLIGSKNNDYRKNGYSLLLSPALRQFSSSDSLLSFTIAHENVLDEYLDRHDGEQTLIQTSLYNYQTHERERKKAEESKSRYMYTAGLAIILVLVLCIGILYLRNRKMKLRLVYHRALDNIDRLENSLSLKEAELTKYKKAIKEIESERMEKESASYDEVTDVKNQDKSSSKKVTEEYVLREQLKERLIVLQRAGEAKKYKPKEILEMSLYARLQEYIRAVRWPDEGDDIWMDIENAVVQVSPEFKSRLTLLVGGKMKPDVYHMALLVKCGFGPTDTGVLLGRSKGAVSSRRSYICEKIFGQKLGARVMDDIIRLL